MVAQWSFTKLHTTSGTIFLGQMRLKWSCFVLMFNTMHFKQKPLILYHGGGVIIWSFVPCSDWVNQELCHVTDKHSSKPTSGWMKPKTITVLERSSQRPIRLKCYGRTVWDLIKLRQWWNDKCRTIPPKTREAVIKSDGKLQVTAENGLQILMSCILCAPTRKCHMHQLHRPHLSLLLLLLLLLFQLLQQHLLLAPPLLVLLLS